MACSEKTNSEMKLCGAISDEGPPKDKIRTVTDQYKFFRDKASRLVNDRRTDMNPLGIDFSQFAVDHSKLMDKILVEYWWPVPPLKGTKIVGFPNRKPSKLYRKIIESFSEDGDVVLDPFCGSGTICLEAARIDRQWIGIDAAEEARTLAPTRLESEVGMGELFKRLAGGPACIVDPPLRADDLSESHQGGCWAEGR